MHLRTFAPFLLIAIMLPACGGGSTGASAGSNGALPGNPVMATGTLTISPSQSSNAKSGSRKPAYISGSTKYATLYIGSTSYLGSGLSPRIACTTTCEFTWIAPSGSQTFYVDLDDGTNVLAEGQHTYTLIPGNNALGTTLTLNGVAAKVAFSSETLGGGTQFSGNFSIEDFGGNAITNAGSSTAFDNGSPTFVSSAPSTGSVTISSSLTPSTSGTDYSFTVACLTSATGTFQIAPSPGSTTGSGDISPSANSLTYPATIGGTVYVYTCTNGKITDSSGTVTLQ
jgi:hypothetical protein